MDNHAIILNQPAFMPDIPRLEAAYKRHKLPDGNMANYNIFLVESHDFQKSIIDILASHGIQNITHDSVITIDTVVSADNAFFDKNDARTNMSYFSDALEFCMKHLGDVYHACIHTDETRLHLHIQSVPTIRNCDGFYSLPIKGQMEQYINSMMMKTLFQADVAEKYGLIARKHF